MEINQYEIVLVNLDPTIGSEMKKTRPCVIISPNEMNKYLNTIVVAPITSSSKDYPSRVKIEQKNISGWIVLDQVRTLDRSRVIKIIGSLAKSEIVSVKTVIMEAYVD